MFWMAAWTLAALAVVAIGSRGGWLRASGYLGRRDDDAFAWTGWFGVGIGLYILQGLGAGVAIAAAGPGAGPLAVTSAASLGGGAGVAAGLAAVMIARPGLSDAGFRFAPRDLWVGALVCLAALPLVTVAGFAGQAVGELAGAPAQELSHNTLRLLRNGTTPGVYALTALAVVVAAPIGEEILFRGFLQTSLRRVGLGPVGGVAAASLFFVSVHATVVDAAMLPALFALSLVLGLAFERTGRLGTVIVAHACFNAFNLWASGV